MRILIQRVKNASVHISSQLYSEIGLGYLVLLGIGADDTEEDLQYLIKKLVGLRVFSDENGHMNLDIKQVHGSILLVSQFTLFADTKKGNRPSFIQAARPETAIPLYEKFIEELKNSGIKEVKTGQFGADMQISLCNDGPVSIWMDSRQR